MKTAALALDHRETIFDYAEPLARIVAELGSDLGSFMEPLDDMYIHVAYTSDCPQEVIDYLLELVTEGGSVPQDMTFTDLNDLKAQVAKLEEDDDIEDGLFEKGD